MFDTADATAFARRLRSDPETMTPTGWVIDWDDAPFPYKLYRAERTPLPGFFLSGWDESAAPSRAWLGGFLKRAYGLVRLRWNPAGVVRSTPSQPRPIGSELRRSLRRAVASGGGLYPVELYVYWRGSDDLAAGIYHYDVAHHALVLLRAGDFDGYVSRALGDRLALDSARMVLFVSVFFWKNLFKYADFCYRLSAQDAGVVIGQALTVAERCALPSSVCFQFLDDALDHLLGLDPARESVYAALAIGADGQAARPRRMDDRPDGRSSDLTATLPAIALPYRERSRTVKRSEAVEAMHRGSRLHDLAALRAPSLPRLHLSGDVEAQRFALPDLPHDPIARFDDTLLARGSSGEQFVPGRLSLEQLGAILCHTTRPWHADVDAGQGRALRPIVGGFLHAVEGLAPGAYAYDPEQHALHLVRPDDFRQLLQRGLLAQNMNLSLVPACMHLIAERDFAVEHLGVRGYRIQQMMAGVMIQRLQHAATMLGLGAHPLLGFSVEDIDQVYGIVDQPLTTLSQVPIGPVRRGLYLEGTLGR